MADPMSDILGNRAAFAAQFQGTTNLAQRRRYQEDIQAAKDYEAERQAGQYDQALGRARLKDPLKAEGLRLTESRDRRSAINAERGFDVRERALELQRFQQERAALREQRSQEDATRIAKQTAAVEDAEFALRENGVMPGTPLYAELMLGHLSRNPWVDPKYRTQLIKENMRIEDDPDEVAIKLSSQNPEMKQSITIGPNGTTYRLREPADPRPEKPIDLLKQRETFVKQSMEDPDPRMKAHYKKLADEMANQILAGGQAPATPGAAPAASAPVRLKFVDGKLVPAQ